MDEFLGKTSQRSLRGISDGAPGGITDETFGEIPVGTPEISIGGIPKELLAELILE